jgi:glycerate 2-kinase
MTRRNDLRESLTQVFQAALGAADPDSAVRRTLHCEGPILTAGNRRYDLRRFKKVLLAGVGKAGVPMARAVEAVCGPHLNQGLVVVKHGHGGYLEKTRVLESGHPEPDEHGERAAIQMLDLVSGLTSDDLLILVISGGGSALLPAPIAPLSLEVKKLTTSVLIRAGATIQEMNKIRKHLSRLKGGRLIEHTGGATLIALLLSDVVGDDLSSIASGLTSPDPSTYTDCLEILQKYDLYGKLPGVVVDCLQAGAAGLAGAPPETPKPGHPGFERVHNLVVASNILALEAAARKSEELGYRPIILSSSMYGNTADLALAHVAIAREALDSGNPMKPPCCLISGGETTVKVTGNGKGGRNQEFALWCARDISSWTEQEVLFASLGSDGTDGPTDAAGAFADPSTTRRGAEKGLNIDDYLRRNDSYHFFRAIQDLIVTGPTQTNVMDFRFVMIGSRG